MKFRTLMVAIAAMLAQCSKTECSYIRTGDTSCDELFYAIQSNEIFKSAIDTHMVTLNSKAKEGANINFAGACDKVSTASFPDNGPPTPGEDYNNRAIPNFDTSSAKSMMPAPSSSQIVPNKICQYLYPDTACGQTEQLVNSQNTVVDDGKPVEANHQLLYYRADTGSTLILDPPRNINCIDSMQWDSHSNRADVTIMPLAQDQESMPSFGISEDLLLHGNVEFSSESMDLGVGMYDIVQNVLSCDMASMIGQGNEENPDAVVGQPAPSNNETLSNQQGEPSGIQVDSVGKFRLKDLADFNTIPTDCNSKAQSVWKHALATIKHLLEANSICLYNTSALLLTKCVKWKWVDMVYTYDSTDDTKINLASMRISNYAYNKSPTPCTHTNVINRISNCRIRIQCWVIFLYRQTYDLIYADQPHSGAGVAMDGTASFTLPSPEDLKSLSNIEEGYGRILDLLPSFAEKSPTAYSLYIACLDLACGHAQFLDQIAQYMVDVFNEITDKYKTLEDALHLQMESSCAKYGQTGMTAQNIIKLVKGIYTPRTLESWTKEQAEDLLKMRYILGNYAPLLTTHCARRLKAFAPWDDAEIKPNSSTSASSTRGKKRKRL